MSYKLDKLLGGLGLFVVLQRQLFGLLTALVHCDHLKCPVGAYRHQIGRHRLVGRIGYLTLEYIGLEVIVGAVECLKGDFTRRHALYAFDIGVDLEVEATFQLGTLSGKFLGIERYVLIACSACGYRHEVGHPARTAQRSSARSYTADATRFLAGTDLLHLYSHLKCFGKNLDELSEVDTLVGDIVEYRLVAVALILDIADFHVQLEAFGDFARTYHRVVLLGFGFFILFKVVGLCLSEYSAYFGIGTHIGLLHLDSHKASGERHHANVMTRRSFYGNHVADGELQVG